MLMRANETVEKPYFALWRCGAAGLFCNQNAVEGVPATWIGLGQRPKGVDLADIVNQSEQPPLYIHFPFGT